MLDRTVYFGGLYIAVLAAARQTLHKMWRDTTSTAMT